MRTLENFSFARACSLLSLSLCAACGGSDSGGLRGSYAIESFVFAPEGGGNSYVNVVEDLDSSDQIGVTGALEFGGFAEIGSFDGDLFIKDGESPEIARISRNAAGIFEEIGRVSFANSEVSPSEVGAFISGTKTYTGGGSVGHVIWNPTEMAIDGELDFTLDARTDFIIRSSNRSVTEPGRYYRTFFWQNGADIVFSEETRLLVVDTETDEVVAVPSETRCPVLNKMTTDNQGNTYFSTWLYSAPVHHMYDGPATCAVRKLEGADDFDPTFQLDFAELTDGREAAELSHVSGDKFILSVFHHERADIEGAETAWALAQTPNWRIWLVDMGDRTAAPIEEIGWSAGDHVTARIDGRFLVFAPNADYDSTIVYEIHSDGTATQLFEATGWVTAITHIENDRG